MKVVLIMFVSLPKYARRNAIEHDVVSVNTVSCFHQHRWLFLSTPLVVSINSYRFHACTCSYLPIDSLSLQSAVQAVHRLGCTTREETRPKRWRVAIVSTPCQKLCLGALRTSTNFPQLAMLKILIKTGRFEVSTRIVSDEDLRRLLRARQSWLAWPLQTRNSNTPWLFTAYESI